MSFRPIAYPDHPVSRVALLLLTLLFGAGCSSEKTYDVRGRIAGFGDDDRTVFIEHEAIPGYMPAMVMPFTLADSTVALTAFGVGQAVGFTLHVTGQASWITGLHTLPDEAVAAHPAASTKPAITPSPALQRLQPGNLAPPFELVDQDGDTLHLNAYRGKALLLTFIYTRCPIPDFCPLMSEHFKTLQPRLREHFGDRVQLLSISFDPAYDTPERLRDYGMRYTNDFSTWQFATGEAEHIQHLAQRYGVYFELEASAETFAHNLVTALIGPGGRVHQLWRGNRWQPDEVIAAIEQAFALPSSGSP